MQLITMTESSGKFMPGKKKKRDKGEKKQSDRGLVQWVVLVRQGTKL